MSSLNSVGGNSSSASLYQLMMQELQNTSISTSINTQSSLSTSLAAIDQILFSSSAGVSPGDGAGTSPDAALSNPLQQYLADVYGTNSGS